MNRPASRPCVVDEHDRPGAAAGVPHLREHRAHGVRRRRDAQFVAVPHALRDGRELAAEAAGRVELGELLRA